MICHHETESQLYKICRFWMADSCFIPVFVDISSYNTSDSYYTGIKDIKLKHTNTT